MKTPAGSVAAYAPPSRGPFRCDTCEYYVQKNRCERAEVVKELGDAGKGLAKVEPSGCCNYHDKKNDDVVVEHNVRSKTVATMRGHAA